MQCCIKKCDKEENLNEFKYMFTPCKHLFHYECLKAWLEMKNTCPECRSILPVDMINSGHIPLEMV